MQPPQRGDFAANPLQDTRSMTPGWFEAAASSAWELVGFGVTHCVCCAIGVEANLKPKATPYHDVYNCLSTVCTRAYVCSSVPPSASPPCVIERHPGYDVTAWSLNGRKCRTLHLGCVSRDRWSAIYCGCWAEYVTAPVSSEACPLPRKRSSFISHPVSHVVHLLPRYLKQA